MATNPNLTYGKVTGFYSRVFVDGLDVDTQPETMPISGLQITFTPSVAVLVNPTAKATIQITTFPATTDEDGNLCTMAGDIGIELPASIDPLINETGWTWTVTIQGPVGGYPREQYAFTLSSGQEVDLSTVVKLPSSLGTQIVQWEAAVAETAANAAAAEANAAAAAASAASVDPVAIAESIDAALATKANTADVYTKTATDDAVAVKLDTTALPASIVALDANAASALRVQQDARQAATIAAAVEGVGDSAIAALESVPMSVYGDSYGHGDQGASQASRPFNRIAVRHRTLAPVIQALSGTRMDQMATKVKDTWVPNQYGIVGIADGVINDEKQYADTTGTATTREAFRTALAYLTSKAVSAIGSSAFSFAPGWSAGASSTPGSYFHAAFTAPSAYLLVNFVTGTGAVLTVTTLAGAAVATINTGGYKQSFVGAVKLAGNGTTAKEFKVALTSGATVIYGIAVPSPAPPLIVWDKPGQFNSSSTEFTRLTAYLDAAEEVLSDFPSVVQIEPGAGWDRLTMISSDSTHRNDRGNRYTADQIDAALRTVLAGEYDGLNRITAVPTYATPTVTPAVNVVTYSADTFTRSDGALGSTEAGAFAWAATGGTGVIASNAAKFATVDVAGSGATLLVDDGQANGTFKATRRAVGGGQGVIFFRGDSTSFNGYVLWQSSTTYTLSKRTAAGSYSPLGTAAGITPTIGDVIEIVANGSSIVVKINGATVITVTDASYAGTRHGFWSQNALTTVDDFSHTDQV